MKQSFWLLLACWLGVTLPGVAVRADGDLPLGRRVEKIGFRGNVKVEAAAMQRALSTEERFGKKPAEEGQPLKLETIQDDLKTLWKMRSFDDVRIEWDEGDSGGIQLWYVVREKRSVRKIYVSGNSEVGLDKINEVLDLKKETIYDPAKIKRNVEKIHDLYVEKGFYLADVKSEIKIQSATQLDVYFIVDEHAKVEVRKVTFLGNRNASDDELHSVMATQEGNWLSFLTSAGTYREDAFERDVLLLTAFYYDKGYVTVKIGKPTVEMSPDKRFLYISIPIEEGEVYKLGKLDFQGELLLTREEMLAGLKVKPGEQFNRSKLGQDIQNINNFYKNRGYANVNVTPLTQIDADKKIVDLTFDLQQGKKVFFERINVRGNTKTRDKVIRRELKIIEGELYSEALVEFSKNRVQALGFFEKVEISTKRGTTDERIEVNIEVTERPTGTFQVGAGFSSIENFIAQAQIAQNNLFGRGTTLRLSAQVSSLRQLFSVNYIDPYFLDTNVTFSFSGYNQLLYYPNFNRTTRGGDLTWGYLFGDYLRLLGTYKLEWVSIGQNSQGMSISGFGQVQSIAGGTLANLYRRGWTSSVRLWAQYDSRNDRMFPTKGMFHLLSLEVADRYVASEIDYVRISGYARFYRPIWGPFIFRLNAESGLVFSRRAEGVPIYERYFLGGIQSIRGFRLFSLGPRIQIQSALEPGSYLIPFSVGANWQLILNSEIEFMIIPAVQIKGVLFFDMGNGYNLEAKYCTSAAATSALPEVFNPCSNYPTFQNLRYSVGFGFRWFSPIGPLRFEWGIPLNPQTGEDPLVFEFTIGNFF